MRHIIRDDTFRFFWSVLTEDAPLFWRMIALKGIAMTLYQVSSLFLGMHFFKALLQYDAHAYIIWGISWAVILWNRNFFTNKGSRSVRKAELSGFLTLANKTHQALVQGMGQSHNKPINDSLATLLHSWKKFVELLVLTMYTSVICLVACVVLVCIQVPFMIVPFVVISAIHAGVLRWRLGKLQWAAVSSSAAELRLIDTLISMSRARHMHWAMKSLGAFVKNTIDKYAKSRSEYINIAIRRSELDRRFELSLYAVTIGTISWLYLYSSLPKPQLAGTAYALIASVSIVTSQMQNISFALDSLILTLSDARPMAEEFGNTPKPLPTLQLTDPPVFTSHGLKKNGIAFPNVTIGPGLYVLTTPSGRGKSTLFRLLAGIEPPDEGYIMLNGKPISSHDIRDLVCYVEQNPPDVTMPVVSLFNGGDAAYALRFTGLPIAKLASALTGMSGGELRRAYVAGAVSALIGNKNVKVVLLDEPTNGLDSEATEHLAGSIRELSSKRPDLIIMVATHDNVAKRILTNDRKR